MILTGTVLYQISQEDLDKAYICPATNVTGIFDKVSSTNITGYYTINGTAKSMQCKSKWLKLTTWCDLNNFDCQEFVKTGFPSDDKLVPEDVYDEKGALIYKDVPVTVDKSMVLNVNGTLVNITYKGTIKCICDKLVGCKIQECLQ